MQLTSQSRLPLIPAEAKPIGLAAGLLEDERGGVVFLHGLAAYQWDAGDEVARRLAAIQLYGLKVANAGEIGTAFGSGRASLFRWKERQKQGGSGALASDKPGPRGPSKLKPETLAQIEVLDSKGLSGREIGRRLGLVERTVRRGLGRDAKAPGRAPSPASSAGTSEVAAPAEPGIATTELVAVAAPAPRLEERQAARRGELEEAAPVFTQGRELPLVGLLLALPALAESGLLEVAEEIYGKLRNGFYGLRSTLLTLLFLALLREPRAEGASRIGPSDLGRVLGLDRAPEVKTIRRKLGELTGVGRASELLWGLARKHVQARPDALGYLYLDGHVRVYSGTRRLPKAHVTRLRIAAPATEEMWVSDADGEPVLVLIQEPGTSLVKQVRALLPELKELLQGRRLTVCFDRGGWSPELFYDLTQAGFDFITYRKGRSRREPARAFQSVDYLAEGVVHRYELADSSRRIRLPKLKDRAKTLGVRQVVRRIADHQSVIVTSRRDLSAGEIAFRMFSRWRQENYFRYGRQHFGLDALDSYAVHADDSERLVSNPKRQQVKRDLERKQERRKALEAEVRKIRRDPGGDPSSTQLDLRVARTEVAYLEALLAQTPARVPLSQVAPEARLLDPEPKLITHAVRLTAYNAESALARLLAPFYRRAQDEGRALLREAFKASGDLEIVDGRLEVRLNHLSAPRRTRALADLCQLLSQSETTFPGTDLVLHYSVKTSLTVS
ncbi:MAG TPA: hypothetical protein VMV09_08915 [Candidatus Saccharimonadales bacterium]|nr:hypothetical protein [Candidatus Saccharimonadales bacterium]